MSWRSAFLLQARSDNNIRQQLNVAKVEYCHQLHYLQMVTEKLAKALVTPENATQPPAFSHAMFVSGLKAMKGRPDIRRLLGYDSFEQFRAAINSLLPLADKIERLAPALANGPNPEYPWQTNLNSPVVAPVEFSFADFDLRKPQMAKLLQIIDRLLVVLT